MGGGGNAADGRFDLEQIRRLAELMTEHDLTEIAIGFGRHRLRLRRGAETLGAAPPPARPAAAVSAEPAAAPAEDHLHAICSPMVGTFYSASNPESPPFVKVGDHVGPETTVCIVEAMKVFNEISAEVSGKIVAVLVENGEPVEFGQPLFKVDPRV